MSLTTSLKSFTAAFAQTGKAFVRLFKQHVRVRTATLIVKIWLGFKREFLNALVVCTKVPTIHLSKMLYLYVEENFNKIDSLEKYI